VKRLTDRQPKSQETKARKRAEAHFKARVAGQKADAPKAHAEY
jgi:hypothetical protein